MRLRRDRVEDSRRGIRRPMIIEKPLGARQPAGPVRRFPSEKMRQAEPEPPAGGLVEGLPIDAGMMQSVQAATASAS